MGDLKNTVKNQSYERHKIILLEREVCEKYEKYKIKDKRDNSGTGLSGIKDVKNSR